MPMKVDTEIINNFMGAVTPEASAEESPDSRPCDVDVQAEEENDAPCAEVVHLTPRNLWDCETDTTDIKVPMFANYTTFQSEAQSYAPDRILNVAVERLRDSGLAISGAIVVIAAELYLAKPIQTLFRRIINYPGAWNRNTTDLLGAMDARIKMDFKRPAAREATTSDFQMIRVAPNREVALHESSHPYMRQYWLRIGEEGRLARSVIRWPGYSYRECRDLQTTDLKKAYENAKALQARVHEGDRAAVSDAIATAILLESLASYLDCQKRPDEPYAMSRAVSDTLSDIWPSAIRLINRPKPPGGRYKTSL